MPSPSAASPREPQPVLPDEIDLREVVLGLWAHRWLITILTAIGAGLALAFGLQSARYTAESVLQVPGIDISAYRRAEGALHNQENFARFLEYADSNDAPPALRSGSAGALASWIRPQFRLTEQQARALGLRPDGNQEMLGIRLQFESPEAGAWRALPVFAEYVRDTIARIEIASSTASSCIDARSGTATIESELSENRFTRGQLTATAKRLNGLIARAGTLRPSTASAFVPSPEETILSRLIETEIKIAESEIEERALRHRQRQAELRVGYYCNLQDSATEAMPAHAVLATAREALETAVPDAASDEAVARVRVELSSEIARWDARYIQNTRLIAPPQGSEKRRQRAEPVLLAIVGAGAGLLIGAFLALIFNWWRREK